MAYLLVAKRYEGILEYETVRRWSKGLKEGTGRRTGLYHLARYLEYLKRVQIRRTPDQLIEDCIDGNNRTLNEHLDMLKGFVEGDTLGSLSRSARERIYVSIRSFYMHNRVHLLREPLRFNDDNSVVTKEQGSIMLDHIRKAVSHKGCSVRDRAIILCMMQSGMDDSTLADVFNHVAYPQMVKHFGTEDHASWSLDECPIRIDLVRPKTGYRYYSFIDRDATEALKDWLNVRLSLTGKKLSVQPKPKPNELPKSDPLFIVKKGQPVRAYLVSKIFRDVGVEAGIIIKPNAKAERFKGASRRYAFHSHEVRDLLKSLARVCGIDTPVADFFLGHSIDKLGYDKNPWNFPEHFRVQYMKMSNFINVLTQPASRQDSNSEDVNRKLAELEDDKVALEKRLAKMEQETRQLKGLVRQLAGKVPNQ
jgi:hypothetical protein